MSDFKTTLNACELVWRQQSMADRDIAEMRAELESHLREAALAGRTTESVVGDDINAFARTFSGAPNRTAPKHATPNKATTAAAARSLMAEQSRSRTLITVVAILAITVLAALLGPRATTAELEPWQWIFSGSAVALLVGEILTGGFFVLPFGIGALSAAILSFTRVQPPILLAVFIVVSALALWGLREFARKDDDVIVPVGANRYVGQQAVVTRAVNGIGTVGRVRLGTEDWMAIADANERITPDTVVTVVEVRGARLVVSAR